MSEHYFNKKQLKTIELLAAGDLTQTKIAEEVGINPTTICAWKRDPKFMHAVVMRSRALLKEDLPTVYKKLSDKSKEGSHQHIKILLEHLETLDKAYAEETTFTFTWKTKGGSEDE